MIIFQYDSFSSQKDVGTVFDKQQIFCKHLKMLTFKINKTMRHFGKLSNVSPRSALITIYKAFVRPHLDHGDRIYDEACNASFHQNPELFQ